MTYADGEPPDDIYDKPAKWPIISIVLHPIRWWRALMNIKASGCHECDPGEE